MTIKQQVLNAKELLSTFKTHKELRQWALDNNMNSAIGFSNFKKALKEIDIDYEFIKTGINQQTLDDLKLKCTKEVTLFVDAKASAGRYGICDKNGEPLWHGRFFDNDDAGEQSKSEVCAALKAVWLASKIKETTNLEVIKLNLKVDAQWLTYQDHSKQKGYVLTQAARKYNIILNVMWIPGKTNPADEYTICSWYKKWSDNDLSSLIDDIKNIPG